ncbi:ADP-ribose glycohydrolase OARD1 isoform X1 [Coregonus clupeaformis]|uniref:ADP-ribose glycohydrolase OARD1 isoform X1 n=1 Tax=Coregonus clupeaformis TaxID=59861 RepID=UPI001BDFF621|nr:ADP-ribose glycohydrolase OARD1 isoform X1 [Coregonus clupeaformis]
MQLQIINALSFARSSIAFPRRLTKQIAYPSHLVDYSSPVKVMSTASVEPVRSIGKSKPAEGVWSLHHMKGDLFSCPEDEALAHCISKDCHMGAGIAVMFKKKFGGVAALKEQKKVPGQCAVLKGHKRFVYYLITKEKYSNKPTYDSLRQSLEDMKFHCLKNGVTAISMPRIGCGLDRLSWDKVAKMLEKIFQPTGIHITVYTLPVKTTGKPSPRGN